MNGIFEKFSIYDFFGIWGAGALSVSCFLFTVCPLALFEDISEISVYTLIVLYTAGAYLVGVILHELGKILFDLLPCFDGSKLWNRNDLSFDKRPKCPLKAIQYEYASAIQALSPAYEGENDVFHKAVNELKHGNEKAWAKIEKYHSVYALSRSLFLCFAIHALIFTATALSGITDIGTSVAVSVSCAIIALLFYIRTYRYFYSWIKNIRIFYMLQKGKSHSSDMQKPN